jgi:hypothetical protein
MEKSEQKEFKAEFKQNNYIVALKQAKEKLETLNPEEIAEKSGAIFESENNNRFRLTMLAEDYLIDYPSGEVEFMNKDEEVKLPIKVLILHYLNKASGEPLQDKLITYREIPKGGEIYYGPFTKRAINPLVKNFGEKPELLVKASKYLNGKAADLGDYSVTIPVFPKIPVTFVIWQGDDELPPSGNVLFDASVVSYLPAEDLAFVGSVPLWALGGIAKNL